MSKFRNFAVYNNYSLFIDPKIKSVNELLSLIRLDNLSISIMLFDLTRKELSKEYYSRFINIGIIRTIRLPLGYITKKYYIEGEEDYEGTILS